MRPIEKRLDKLASELCKIKYNGRCYTCGHAGTDTHHVVNRSHKRQRWNIENLFYLCRDCHLEAHEENWTFNIYLDQSVYIWSLPELQDLERELKAKIKGLL